MTPSLRRGRDVLCLALVLAIGLGVACPRYRRGGPSADEGFLAYGAVEILQGKLPNRDFVSLQPPLSFATAAMAFKFFGASLLTLRGFGVIVYLGIAMLTFAILREIAGPVAAVCGALSSLFIGLPYFNFTPFAVWQGMLIILAATFCLLVAVRRQSKFAAILAGLLTAVSLTLRHDQTAYFAFAAALLFFLEGREKPGSRKVVFSLFLAWLSAFLTSTAGIGLYFWLSGSLGAVVHQLLLFPFTTYTKTSSVPFPCFSENLSVGANTLIAFFYLVPIFYLGIGVVTFLRRKHYQGKIAVLAFLLVWAALFYLQTLTRTDVPHFIITLPPFFILVAYIGYLLLSRRSFRFLILAIVIALGAGFIWQVRSVVLPPLDAENESLAVARGGVLMTAGDSLTHLVRAIQHRAPPDRSILALPYQPILYFLSERRNPTRWNYLWPGDQSSIEHAELVREAEADPPALVILTNEDELAGYAPEVIRYTQRDFKLLAKYPEQTIYVPR